jgi:hypothetical protein
MRSIADPFVVRLPAGARVRTRLRLTPVDEAVLRAVGAHLGRLAGHDLAWRCRLGRSDDQRTVRKHAATSQSSSRWAGTITRTSNDQWQRGLTNLANHQLGLRRAVRSIRTRLAVPVGGKQGRVHGYATQAERYAKQRRLQHLEGELANVEDRLSSARVSVCRGGHRLAKLRHRLDRVDVELTEAEWQACWQARRWFLTADGDATKRWGNETIRVHPEQQWLELRLPTPMAGLSNTPGRACTYRLACPVTFHHRRDEWAVQAATGPVRYDISYQPGRNRWYLDASWQTKATQPPAPDELRRSRALGVDLNADHLACWVLDSSGNPVGRPHTIPLYLDALSTSTRDGRLRVAIAALLRLARTKWMSLHRGRGPGFHRCSPDRPRDPWAWAPRPMLPQDHLGNAHSSLPKFPGRNGRQRRPMGHRGGPQLDLQVGATVLVSPAQPVNQILDRYHAPSRGGGGDRPTWPGRRRPATARCGRPRPEDRGWRATGQTGPAAP